MRLRKRRPLQRPQPLRHRQLRHFFEVDRHWVTLAALKALADAGTIGRDKVAAAMVKYQLDPSKPNPMSV